MKKNQNCSGSFLHSYYFGENPRVQQMPPKTTIAGSRGFSEAGSHGSTVNGENFPLQKTKSSDAVVDKPRVHRPGKLSKTKSSTFISPDQSEKIMYNSKVTLTLRRSRLSLNSEDDSEHGTNSEVGDETGIRTQPILPNGRVLKRAEEMRSQCPTPPPLSAKPTLRQTVRGTSDLHTH